MTPCEPVSVVIPAYNEERGVAGVVREVRRHLKAARVTHEILVVDDGSRDETASQAKKAGAQIIQMGENRGYGASLKAGIPTGPVRPHRHPGRRRNLSGRQIYRHSLNWSRPPIWRWEPGSSQTRPFRLYAGSRSGFWAGVGGDADLADEKSRDLNSGLRVFRKKIAGRYEGLFPNGFSFDHHTDLGLGMPWLYRSLLAHPIPGTHRFLEDPPDQGHHQLFFVSFEGRYVFQAA